MLPFHATLLQLNFNLITKILVENNMFLSIRFLIQEIFVQGTMW